MTLRTLRRFAISRRRLVVLGLSLPLPLLVACSDDEPESASGASGTPTSPSRGAAASPTAAAAGQPQLEPTPACGDDDDEPTAAQTEGPFFTPNSPERTSLVEAGEGGTRLLLTGYVLDTACRPIGRVLLDFWQCDIDGNYDTAGYRYRGHQFTDAQGRYELTTIVPGLYPGRTRHIHVKAQAANQPVLTTQLYFPDEARNNTDRLYNAELQMELGDSSGGGKAGKFDFVL